MSHPRGVLEDTRALEIAAGQHGVVTRQQALKAGMSRRQIDAALDRGLLVVAHRGVYRAAGSERTFEQSVLAAFADGAVPGSRAWAATPPIVWTGLTSPGAARSR